MAIKFTPAPTFKSKVEIANPGGDPLIIEFEFKHKTRTEFNSWARPTDRNQPHEEAVLEIAAAWTDVELPFGRDALTDLFEKFPSAPVAIYGTYSEALLAGKTKN